MDNRNQFKKWFDVDEKVATGVIRPSLVIVLIVAAYFASQSTGPSGYHSHGARGTIARANKRIAASFGAGGPAAGTPRPLTKALFCQLAKAT